MPSGSGRDSNAGAHEYALDGVHIVVADDSADERELLSFVFERQGARVTAVESAIEALTAIDATKPDVLVSDIGFAGRDGYSLVRELRTRKSSEGGDTPAMALSGWARASDRAEALDAGFQVYLSKPVDIRTLVATVASLARTRRRQMPTALYAEGHTLGIVSNGDALLPRRAT